jgi:hypothetical protein
MTALAEGMILSSTPTIVAKRIGSFVKVKKGEASSLNSVKYIKYTLITPFFYDKYNKMLKYIHII